MSSPSDDLCSVLASLGHGTFVPSGGTLFAGEMPDAPDALISIRDTLGFFPTEQMVPEGDATVWENPSVQVSVRDLTYAACYARAEAACKALRAVNAALINGVRYVRLACQNPAMLRRDEATPNGRVIFVFNIEITREPA